MTDRELMDIAEQAAKHSYSPYSRFAVGAALECFDGTVFTGCNVENAALGSEYAPSARQQSKPSARDTPISSA